MLHLIINDCFQRVVFIGDSHTRYYFYYFLYLLNKMPINIVRKLETELHIDKLSFLWSPYEKDLISHLNSFAKGKCAAAVPLTRTCYF